MTEEVEIRLGREILRRVLAQFLNVRFFEAAEQHAGPSATKSWAKPTGCKQPVGTATAITRLRLAGPDTRCAAEACC